ncbi:hypothetical protein [uncultured Olsenella sp.]|uniref:hypothetical protein n=1 Tax=uncultured Olsenella sp. TaxID=190764 RepID=UPI0034C68E45
MRGMVGRMVGARLADGTTLGRFELRERFCERARGLLGTGPDAMPIVIMPCHSIHCVGMRYAIDVAFLDGGGRVLLVRRALRAGTILCCHGAAAVLERPAGSRPWPLEGSHVELFDLSGGESRPKRKVSEHG